MLDKVLEDMDNPDLNAQLKILAEEKQSILEQMAALQEKAEQQALQVSRRRELEAWLGQQPMMFTEYDDGVTRRLVEWIKRKPLEELQTFLQGNPHLQLTALVKTWSIADALAALAPFQKIARSWGCGAICAKAEPTSGS